MLTLASDVDEDDERQGSGPTHSLFRRESLLINGNGPASYRRQCRQKYTSLHCIEVDYRPLRGVLCNTHMFVFIGGGKDL